MFCFVGLVGGLLVFFVRLFDLKNFTKTKESCEISRVWYEIKLSFVNAAQCLKLTNSNMHLITLESIFRTINLSKILILTQLFHKKHNKIIESPLVKQPMTIMTIKMLYSEK